MLKSYGWVGTCDFCVSPSPIGLDFGTLDFGLGLDNISRGLRGWETRLKISDKAHTHLVLNFHQEIDGCWKSQDQRPRESP